MSKTFLFQAIQLNQTVLIETIHFSLSIDFVYIQLNVQFQTIQFSLSVVGALPIPPLMNISSLVNVLTLKMIFISICTNGRHKALKFCGGGEGRGHAFVIY